MAQEKSGEAVGRDDSRHRAVDAVIRIRAALERPIRGIAFAVVVVAVGYALRAALPNPGVRFVVLYPTVALAALAGGWLAGLVATLLAAAVATVLVFEPSGSLTIANPADLVSLVNFVATGLLISAAASLDGVITSRLVVREREHESAQRRHRAMIDALHEGFILFSPDGEVVYANPSAERILGFAPGDLVADQTPFGRWRLVAEDGTAMRVEDYPASRVLATGEAVVDRVIGVPIGDRLVWLLNNATPMIDPATGAVEGVITSFLDVTERRRIVRELEENRAQLRSVFDALQEGVMVFDPSGTTLSCNRAAERILRRNAEDLIGGRGFLAYGRRVVREDGSEFPIEERPIRRVLATGEPRRGIVAGVVDADETFWVSVNAEPVYDGKSPTPIAVVASFTDISERRRREWELADSRAHLASIFAAVHEAILVFAPDGRILDFNPAAERVLRVDGTDLRGLHDAFTERRLVREDGSELPRAEYPAVRTLTTGEAVQGVVVGAPAADGVVWLLANSEPIRDPRSGDVVAAVVSLNDISETVRVRRQVDESRARFASIVDSAMDAVISVDENQIVVLFNRAAERILGITAAEVIGRPIDLFVPADRLEAHRRGFHNFAAGEATSRHLDGRAPPMARRADGTEFPIEASISRSVVDGRPLYTMVMRDITERLEAQRTDAQLATVVRASPDAILKVSLDGRIETWNEAATRIFGWEAEEAVGKPIGLLSFPDLPVSGTSIYQRVLAGETVRQDVVRRHKNGTPIQVSSAASPVRDADGRVVAGVAVLSDITERVMAARQLTERDEQLRQTLDAAGLGVWWIEVESGLVHCDQRSRALFSAGETEAIDDLAAHFVAEDRPLFLDLRSRAETISTGRPLVIRRDGETGDMLWLALTARRKAEDGAGEEVWGTVQDITEARRAEETARRFEASRRLEALGRMSGGIAHDLNNLLTVISGNLQLLEMSPQAEASGRWIAEALRASESGAALNQRLLTFARQRRLDPALIELDVVVGSMMDLLHRAVGPKIGIATAFAADVGPVRVDRTEIESALVNLVINARDAMPDGGRILIETREASFADGELPPEAERNGGDYVRLTVSDTGHGMPPEVRAKAFEPFFTTKAAAQGSGLGLATLHGFVKQMGGFITLYSEVGRGTAVNVYLPRADGQTAARQTAKPAAAKRGAGERILVVDDNREVRVVTCERLETLGYRVESAEDADDALRIIGSGEHFDLVLTDVVMPGSRSGFELAQSLRETDPEQRILVCSGFAGDLVGGAREPGRRFPFLSKPYSLAELAGAVAAALEH